jgi:hypothetical protein
MTPKVNKETKETKTMNNSNKNITILLKWKSKEISGTTIYFIK